MRSKAAFLLLAAALFALAAGPRTARAAGPSIWSALVCATNEEHPKEAPPELRKFESKLKNVFGYNQFELVGQHTERMDDPAERWLIPSKDFSLHVTSQTAAGNGYVLKLEMFQEARPLAKFEARLGPQSPLFIRGPLYGRGQLIIVLLVK